MSKRPLDTVEKIALAGVAVAVIALLGVLGHHDDGGASGVSSASVVDAQPAVAAVPVTQVGTVLLNVSGSGQHQTQMFTAVGDWDIAYAFDCSNFGPSGNFIVIVYGSDGNMSFGNTGLNELGPGRSGITHEHHGGTYYLAINSECNWTMRVLSA